MEVGPKDCPARSASDAFEEVKEKSYQMANL